MSNKYTREILRRNVAQICQTIGWHSTNSTPLDILVHVLEKYLLTLGTQALRYAEEFNRSEPNLHDMGLVFRDLNLQLPELGEYVKTVPPVPSAVQIDKFPKPKESNLNFLKPGSHEVVTRPMHVHEHLPAMYPEKEVTPTVADTIEIRQNGHISESTSNMICKSPEISVTDSPDRPKDVFKRPIDPVSTPPSMKRPRLTVENEECHTREISSVMMTMSGFLSPAREGKLPEARAPSNPERQADRPRHPAPPSPALLHKIHDRSEKKSKKHKLLNGKIIKNKKKDRSHKAGSNKLNKIVNSVRPEKVSYKNKNLPLNLNNHTMAPPIARVKPNVVPTIDNAIASKPIKQEPQPLPPMVTFPSTPSPLAPLNQNTVPSQSKDNPPVTTNSTSSANHNQLYNDNFDSSEKLTSQPDKSKLDIFKKISNKAKEDRFSALDSTPNKTHLHDSSRQFDKLPSQNISRHELNDTDAVHSKVKYPLDHAKNIEPETLAVDLSSKKFDLTTNEVISLDDDSFDMRPPLRQDILSYDYPNDLSKPKHVIDGRGIPPIETKLKKERKRKERKEKPTKEEKIFREYAKMLKKQQQQLQAVHSNSSEPFAPLPRPKPTKQGRPPKSQKAQQNMHPGFPFYSMAHNRGLLGGPGLLPNPGLLQGDDLFAGLASNPALRGLIPGFASGLLANPFAMAGGRSGMHQAPPTLSSSSGPTQHRLPNPLMTIPHSFGQPPRLSQQHNLPPLLRRPSLEVIPVDNDNIGKSKHIVPPSPLRDKEKVDKQKFSTIPNILQKHSIPKHRNVKENQHKHNALLKMPPVEPDVTIQLNPPVVKTEPVTRLVDPETPPRQAPSTVEPARVPSSEPPPREKDKEKSDKKKDKLHKKDKKEKDQVKLKKKKEKKEKHKLKEERKKSKERKHDNKEKTKKEKKDKRKEKEKDKEKDKEKEKERPSAVEGVVPKLTLKLGSASPMPPDSPDVPFKLNIKPVIKKEKSPPPRVDGDLSSPTSRHSPELAQISALVTRPPKLKNASKHNHSNSSHDRIVEPAESGPSESRPGRTSPSRKSKSASSKYKRIYFKPIPKKTMAADADDSILDSEPEERRSAAPESPPIALPEGAAFYTDEQGNKVWVCPACGRPDNGSPMIGCDGCDGWYHWACVGIVSDPGASEDWYCRACRARRLALPPTTTLTKKRGRKPKGH